MLSSGFHGSPRVAVSTSSVETLESSRISPTVFGIFVANLINELRVQSPNATSTHQRCDGCEVNRCGRTYNQNPNQNPNQNQNQQKLVILQWD